MPSTARTRRLTCLIPIAALALSGCDAVEAIFDGSPDAGITEVAVGDDCDPRTRVFCGSVDRIAHCGDDGEVERLLQACPEGTICAEGNGTAACVLGSREACATDHCSADDARVFCGETGHVTEREPCHGVRVCAEGRGAIDCVLPEFEPCEHDGCSADARGVSLCSPTGFVDRRLGCDDELICVAEDSEATCVHPSLTPCERTTRTCTEAGDAVVKDECATELGLSRGVRTLHTCDPDIGGCTEVGGVADCMLDADIPCEVEYQDLGDGFVLATSDDPVVCLDDRLVRCNDFGRLAAVAYCEWGCETAQWGERTRIGACN